jgi:hypothetical protein
MRITNLWRGFISTASEGRHTTLHPRRRLLVGALSLIVRAQADFQRFQRSIPFTRRRGTCSFADIITAMRRNPPER